MKRLRVSELIPGMIMGEDVYTYNGKFLFAKGAVLTDQIINRLEFYSINSIRVDESVMPELPAKVDEEEQNYAQKLKKNPRFKVFKNQFSVQTNQLKSVLAGVANDSKDIDTDAMIENVKILARSSRNLISVMSMLLNLRGQDDLTYVHSMNVALICSVFADWLHLTNEEKETLIIAGLLHDIGKIKMPDEIINKPAKLTELEYEKVKTHTFAGWQILKDKDIDWRIKNVVIQHHERIDGSGYPLGIKGDKIDFFAKIVGIVDTYDAMSSARIYRGPQCPFQVIRMFEEEGFQKYDSRLLLTFLDNVINTFISSRVRLTDGREGTVIYINRFDISRPIVELKNGGGAVDLSKDRSIDIDNII